MEVGLQALPALGTAAPVQGWGLAHRWWGQGRAGATESRGWALPGLGPGMGGVAALRGWVNLAWAGGAASAAPPPGLALSLPGQGTEGVLWSPAQETGWVM